MVAAGDNSHADGSGVGVAPYRRMLAGALGLSFSSLLSLDCEKGEVDHLGVSREVDLLYL